VIRRIVPFLLLLGAAPALAQSILWTPSPNAVQCQVCTTSHSDPAGEFMACQLVEQDVPDGGRLGYCDHYSDDGHYGGEPGTVDGIRQPAADTYSSTIVIHPVPGVNFDCIGWTDRPGDGSAGHEAAFECFPYSVDVPPPAPRTTARKRGRGHGGH
jgi:hypothetical protein